MGCFLGCFGGAKDDKRRKRRTKRGSPRVQRNRVQNVQQESVTTAEQTIKETPPTNLVSEDKPKGEEQLSPSPRKRVTFNSNITTYEHVSVQESINSLGECNENVGRENWEDLERTSPSHSLSEDASSVISSVGSYPPNHRYHNATDSDDEVEEYGDSDLDDFDDLDNEDDYDDYDDEDIDNTIADQEIWVESVLSIESRIENHTAQEINEEVEAFGSKANARDRSCYVNSVLNPIENITQWKAAKSKETHPLKKRENLTANFEIPRINAKSKYDEVKYENPEIAVDASLSNWLVSHETMFKKSGLDTLTSGKIMSEGSNSARSFEDRPILGELRQISATSSSKKSPIIGFVGTYWDHTASVFVK